MKNPNRKYISIINAFIAGIAVAIEYAVLPNQLLTITFGIIAITNLLMAVWWLE